KDIYQIKKRHKVNYFNFMKYGASRISFKLDKIKKNGIHFNLCFGGGTPHSHGEDTLFIKECLDKKMNIIALPIIIGELNDERESTWFKGYNEKYFFYKGFLFRALSVKYSYLLCLQDLIRNNKLYGNNYSITEKYKLMMRGLLDFDK